MSKDIKFNSLPDFNKEQRYAFEERLRDARGSAEIKLLLHDVFKTTEEHLNFLDQIGGAQKLREFYYEVIKFDLLNGTNTSSYISEDDYKEIAQQAPERLANPDLAEHGVKHRSSLTSTIVAGFNEAVNILRNYGIDPREASLFDLGSGEGKAILIGMSKFRKYDYPFKKAVGIDYLKDVIEIAEANRDLPRNDLEFDSADIEKGNISFKFEDAAKFREYNGINVVYTYNSFDETIMSKVEQNFKKYAGKTVLIYNKPLHRKLFNAENGWKTELDISNDDPDKQLTLFSYGFENV